MKLHSQGPRSFDEAEEAYEALFDSEIFTYPESQSTAKRLALENAVEDTDYDDYDLGHAAPVGGSSDNTPNTLPQILYLSYKNHGQFLLDRLIHRMIVSRESGHLSVQSSKESKTSAIESLELFAEALNRDETDLDLWRRTSRISCYIGSRRLARFSLEAVLDGRCRDDGNSSDNNGLDEVFAREELTEILSLLEDDLSKLQMNSLLFRKKVSKTLKALMDPFPELLVSTTEQPALLQSVGETKVVKLLDCTWTGLGKAILAQRKLDMQNTSKADFGHRYELALPDGRIHETSGALESWKPKKIVSAETLFKARPLPSPTSLKKHEPQGEEVMMIGVGTSDEPITKASSMDSGVPKSGEFALDSGTETVDTKLLDFSDKLKASTIGISQTVDLKPSLKRNSDSAGLQEAGEGGRSRSKRLRARAEVTADEEPDPKDLTKHYEEQLQPYIQADRWLFSVVHELCTKAGITFPSNIASLTQTPFLDEASDSSTNADITTKFLRDFKDSLCSWDLNRSNLLVHGTGSGASVTLLGRSNGSGLAAFLENSKAGGKKNSDKTTLLDQGISDLVRANNESWNDINGLSLLWIEALLRPPIRDFEISSNELPGSLVLEDSKYMQYAWPTSLKDIVCQVLIEEDETFFSTIEKQVALIDKNQSEDQLHGIVRRREKEALVELVQTIFEIHLDIYGKITNPSSKVDQPTRSTQRNRLRRWAELSSNAMSKHPDDQTAALRTVAFRHLWSSVIYVSLIEATSREHVLLCLKDLKLILESASSFSLHLQNNSIMPEISAEAAERETSKLTTMDFFLSIFDPSIEEPVAVIESLEPVLLGANPKDSSTLTQIEKEIARKIRDSQEDEYGTQETLPSLTLPTPSDSAGSHKYQMSEFLRKANASLRLSLWHRLKTAYGAIDFPPMVFLCNIRCINIILLELQSPTYTNENDENRTANLIVWMRNLADLATHCLDLAKTTSEALDFMDEEHLHMALKSCVEIIKLFHVFAQWEDSIRIGQFQAPQQPSGAAVAYRSATTFLREIQPKLWMLLYLLSHEAASQDPKSFPTLKEDLAEYLTATHNTFGMRDYCRLCKKSFLKFSKTELLRLDILASLESEMPQVIYDLYGLKVCQNSSDLQDHGCTGDQIDRPSALEIIDFVMIQARKLNIRDLLKSDIKLATEKMQAVIGIPRVSSVQQSFNRRTAISFFKSPINPLNLYSALRGIGGLTSMPIHTEYAMIAKKKWFFLLGHMLLARYRSQKRVSPDTSDDLDNAVVFFKLHIDFDAEKWETWYRLAQTYDAKIEENTTWNAEKINDPKSDLVAMQRYSIHCYSMAVAGAVRHADDSFDTISKLSDLYTDFGNRIYASSRAPFSMKVFSLHDYERFCNGATRGTYKSPPFREMTAPAAWTFAAHLFRLATVDKPNYWMYVSSATFSLSFP